MDLQKSRNLIQGGGDLKVKLVWLVWAAGRPALVLPPQALSTRRQAPRPHQHKVRKRKNRGNARHARQKYDCPPYL